MPETTKEELVELINMAESKDDIESLVRSVDWIKEDVDKRGSLETVRTKALALVSGESQTQAEDVQDVELMDPNEPEAAAVNESKPRMLKSKKTGVKFIWTEALAKRDDLEEVK